MFDPVKFLLSIEKLSKQETVAFASESVAQKCSGGANGGHGSHAYWTQETEKGTNKIFRF